jgi:hypothetical protein
MSLKIRDIYNPLLETQETELLGSKTITSITTNKRPQTITEYKELLENSKLYDEKKKEKQLLDIMLYTDNRDFIDKFKISSKNEILQDYNKIWNIIKHLRFNKDDYSYNFSNNEYFTNQLLRSIFSNTIHYPLLKINKILFNLHYYGVYAYHKQKTSKYIIPRTELILINTTTDFYETIKLEELITEYIKPFNENKKHSIYLYPFQQALTPNEKILNMENYFFNTIYEDNKDFTSDYLYYTNNLFIYRFKLLYVVKLEEHKLPFQDIYYNIFKIKWNTKAIDNVKDNYICFVKLELFKREKNKLLQFRNKHLGIISKVKKQNPTKKQITEYNKTIDLEKLLAEDTLYRFLSELVLPNNIKLLLDQEKLTSQQIDNLFNPPQEEETIEQQATQQQQTNIINSDTDTDTEEEEDEEENTANINKNKTTHKTNLLFNYNRNYNFSTDDKFIIQNAFINKLKTNKKLQKLTSNYNNVRVIKSFNKTYTQNKYFNFILTNFNNHYTKQYHAYINETNEIISITELIETTTPTNINYNTIINDILK